MEAIFLLKFIHALGASVLFGTGIRLFDRVDPDRLALDQARSDASAPVTHLTYTAGKR